MIDPAELLEQLRARDIRLSVDGDRLKCSAPAGALDVDTRTLLAERKQDLIALLRKADALRSFPVGVVPLKPEGRLPPLFIVSGHGGDVYWMRPLVRSFDADQPAYGIQPPGLDGSKPLGSIRDLAAFEIGLIRQIQPNGPYFIAGHCAGGTLAFEVAQQLAAEGEYPALVAMIGSPFPTAFHWPQPQFRTLKHDMHRLWRHVNVLAREPLAGKFNYVRDKFKQRRAKHGDIAADPAAIAAARHVEDSTMAAVRKYRPSYYNGPIDLFVTLDDWHRAESWKSLAASCVEHDLRFFEVEDFLLGSNVELLALAVRNRLRLAQESVAYQLRQGSVA